MSTSITCAPQATIHYIQTQIHMKIKTQLNREQANAVLKEMKGSTFLINGRAEKVETYSIHPTGGRILIHTNKQIRETTIKELHFHLDQYQEKEPKRMSELIMEEAEQLEPTKATVPAKLPAHVGKSKDAIHFTTDYTLFRSIVGNRELNQNKINRIIKDINSGLNMLPYCPVIVDESLNVIDGQHRFFISRKLKQPVYFVISNKLTLHEIAKVNSNTERWNGKDFIHCYATQGNDNYIRLQAFIDKYTLPITTAIALLSGDKTISGGTSKRELFEKGQFKIADEQKATEVVELAFKFSAHPGYRKREFIEAISKLIKAGLCDFDRLLKKFSSNPDLLKECPNSKTYLQELELLYNKDNSKRTAIY